MRRRQLRDVFRPGAAEPDGEQMNSVFLWSILPVLRELPEFGMTSPARSSTPYRPEYTVPILFHTPDPGC